MVKLFRSLIAGATIALAGSFVSFADETPQTQTIGPFGGLNTNLSPESLPASQSPDLLNVDITQGGRSVKKRQGYGLESALTVSGSAVHNVYKFFDSQGRDVRLAFNDVKINASVNGGAWTVILTTGVTTGATWNCTDYLGFAYCLSSAYDCGIKTDGTSGNTTGVCGTNQLPLGSLIASTGDRLLVGSTSANPSRLYYSASAVFTDFSLGTQSSSSSFEDINAPGSKLTHLAYHYGRWLWWKDQSFGYLVGTGQFDLNIVTVSNTVGTLDDADIYDQGYTYFRGSDNQIYQYDGFNLNRTFSVDISPTLNNSNKKKLNSWNQATAGDFNSGSFTTTTYNVTFAGVTMSTDDVNIPDNSFENAQWTTTGSCFNRTTGVSSTCLLNAPKDGTYMATCSGLGHTVSATVSIKDATLGTIYGSTTVAFGDNACVWVQTTIPNTAPPRTYVNILIHDLSNGGTITSPSFATSGNSITFWYNSAYNGGEWEAYDFFQKGQTDINGSGIYYSNVNHAPNLTTWGSFTANTITNGGTHTFYVRSSTNSFNITSSTPAWVAQSNGSNVSASTGTYFQMSDTFTITASSQNPVLQNFTFNWIEGSASDRMYATYFNNALWFALSIGASATTNNRILRYDLLAQAWTLYDIPANGFMIYNNNLYFGSPTAGNIFRFGNSVSNDNGSSINAYWKSKPFFGDGPFTDKDLRLASWYIASDPGATLTATYTLNESSTVTKSISLTPGSNRSLIQNNWNFPLGSVATNFNVQVGDNSTNAGWEVFGGAVQFVPRPWKVYP